MFRPDEGEAGFRSGMGLRLRSEEVGNLMPGALEINFSKSQKICSEFQESLEQKSHDVSDTGQLRN